MLLLLACHPRIPEPAAEAPPTLEVLVARFEEVRGAEELATHTSLHVEGIVKGTPLVLYNIKSRRAVGPFTAAGPPQRNIAKGAFGGRFDLHVAFFDGPYELLFDAAVDSKSGKGPDIGRWTTWESAVAQKRRRAAPRKASPS